MYVEKRLTFSEMENYSHKPMTPTGIREKLQLELLKKVEAERQKNMQYKKSKKKLKKINCDECESPRLSQKSVL
jgi:hypothetical protein